MRPFLLLRQPAALGAAAALSLGLVACSGDSGGPSSGQVMSQLQAEVVVADADDQIDLATSDGSGADFAIASPMGAGLSAAAVPVFGTQCTPAPTRSPASPSNSDGDAVKDSVHFDFTPPCILSLPLQTITRAGAVDIIDPTPTVTDLGRKIVFTDFTKTWQRVVSGRTTIEERNGTRVVTGDNNQLQHSVTGFRTDYTFADNSTASHLRTWSSTFTADSPGSIQLGSPLPSGTWNITGTSTWTRTAKDWTFSITTNPVLHYNAECTTAPRFDSGVMAIVVTDNTTQQQYTITVTFMSDGNGGCGTPSVSRS